MARRHSLATGLGSGTVANEDRTPEEVQFDIEMQKLEIEQQKIDIACNKAAILRSEAETRRIDAETNKINEEARELKISNDRKVTPMGKL